MASADAARQAVWSRLLLGDLKLGLGDEPFPLLNDNVGAVALAKNPVNHVKIKHHLVRKNVQPSPRTLFLLTSTATVGFDGVVERPMVLTKREKEQLDSREGSGERVGTGTMTDVGSADNPSSAIQDNGPFVQWPGNALDVRPESPPLVREPHIGDVNLVDEGDVLPSTEDMQQMDISFDDEGLNTLERIFLLSKSEYPFHRAYVARVLGDLLNEVDPCESVEYVLPLLGGFSMDEDESVKEAFAQELHRILWYFYSTCKLTLEEVEGHEYGKEIPNNPHQKESEQQSPQHSSQKEENSEDGWAETRDGLQRLASSSSTPTSATPSSLRAFEPHKTTTVTSEGVSTILQPVLVETAADSSPSLSQGQPRLDWAKTDCSHSLHPSVDSPVVLSSNIDEPSRSSLMLEETAHSLGPTIKPHSDDDDDPSDEKGQGIPVDRPTLQVNFFTPLIGSLLLNQNPVISEAVRNGVVAILGRLRDKGELSLELWGQTAFKPESDEGRTFLTQTSLHQHHLRPFMTNEKSMVEHELLQGIIIGMGQLSTDIPDYSFEDSEVGGDPEAFQAQLIQEATTGRAISVNLIGPICEFYSGEEIVNHGFVEEILRSGEGDVSVRAEAAVAMSYIAKVVPVKQIYRLLPLFEQFCQDESDHVRQSVCVAVPALCKRLKPLYRHRSFAIKAIETLTTCSEDVKLTALEILGELIYIFHEDPRGPPQEVLEVYKEDSEVPVGLMDTDWDVITMYNFPGVCLTLGSGRWNEIRDLFHRLQSRAGEKVLCTTAACLHELAKILTPTQVVQDLLPVYNVLLEETEEIRERVFEHIDVIVASVPQRWGWELFQNLAKSWKEGTLGGWRAREKFALHIPSFLETFKGRDGLEEVLEIMRHALLDPYAAVRDAATRGIPRAYESINHDSRCPIAILFRSILLDLSASPSFKQRLTFVHCLREFTKPPLNKTAFEKFFLPVLERLATDVVDVRLGLAQIIVDLFIVGAYYADVDVGVPETIRQLAGKLAADEAVDVRDTIRKVDLHGIEKGKAVLYEVELRDFPDRAVRPGEPSPPPMRNVSPNSKGVSPGVPPSGTPSSMRASTSSSSSHLGLSSASISRSVSSTSSLSASEELNASHTGPLIQIRRPTKDTRVESIYLPHNTFNTAEEAPTLTDREWFRKKKEKGGRSF
nr:hypothetical protein L204_01070 [Cryptococcus depauperatus CBS 7855]